MLQTEITRRSPARPAGDVSPFQDGPAVASGGAAAAAAELRVEVVQDEAQFAALALEWERLHELAPAASIFNSWSWQYAWWGIYGAGRSLRILVARDALGVAGILPLYLDPGELFGLAIRALRLVGCGGDTAPDDLGPLLAPGREAAAARALAAAALQQRGYDALELSDLDDGSPFRSALVEAAAAAGLRCVASDAQRIAYAALPQSWSDYLRSASPSRRQELRYQRARLCAAYTARFRVWDDAACLATGLSELARLHRLRWGTRSRSFATSQYMAMQLRAMEEWMARGWLRLYCLELDGRPAAMAYCCRFRGRVYMLQGGFDPAVSRYSPGNVLLGYALEHAIGEGSEAFDFLRGEHGYKERLATGHRRTVGYTVYASGVAAAAYRARRACTQAMRKAALGMKRRENPS